MSWKEKFRDWLNAMTWGECRVCKKPLGDKFDNRARLLCLRHDALLINGEIHKWEMEEGLVRKDRVQEKKGLK